MKRLVESLDDNRALLAGVLRWPENIGMEMREVKLGPEQRQRGLLLWVDRLAPVEALPPNALEGLYAYWAGEEQGFSPSFPMRRVEMTGEFERALHLLLAGWILLLVDGSDRALLLENRSDTHAAQRGSAAPNKEDLFTRELRMNVALLRNRLRAPELLALPLPIPPDRAGGAALVYLESKASPAMIRAIRRWAAVHLGEEAAARGTLNKATAVWGLLPRFGITPWVEKAAMMADAGYVLLLVDRIEGVYMAPVTLANWMTSPSDSRLDLPLRRWLLRLRIVFITLTLLLPGAVVSLLNYHQEMIPTAFLLAVGSARESAPFATVFEVFLLEAINEIAREASFRVPMAVPIGLMMIAYALLVILAVQVGFVGPLPAVAAVIGSLAALAIPGHGLAYLLRLWRFILLFSALILGFFGMAALFTLLITYLCQAVSWGVPFLGPSGPHLTAPESPSSRRPNVKGGKKRGKALVR